MSRIETVEATLRAAIRSAQEDGWALQNDRMLGVRACCALGAVVRDSADRMLSDNMAFDEAMHRLALADNEGIAIARGFDGLDPSDWEGAFYDLGRRLRVDYLGEAA